MGNGSRVFLTFTDIRLFFHEAAPEFQAKCCGCGRGKWEALSLNALGLRFSRMSVSVSSAKSLTQLWMLQLWVFVGMQKPQMTFTWKRINICCFCFVSYDTGIGQRQPELIKLIVNYKLFFPSCSYLFYHGEYFQTNFLIFGLCPKPEWNATLWVGAAS